MYNFDGCKKHLHSLKQTYKIITVIYSSGTEPAVEKKNPNPVKQNLSNPNPSQIKKSAGFKSKSMFISGIAYTVYLK